MAITANDNKKAVKQAGGPVYPIGKPAYRKDKLAYRTGRPAYPESFRGRLNKILTDKTSGSTKILSDLNKYLSENLKDRKEIEVTVIKAKKYLSHFASVKNYLSFVEKLLKRGNDNKLEVFIRLFNEVHLSKYQQLYENAKPFLKNVNSVVTISNSGTLLEILKLLAVDRKKLHVLICESRPRNEGRLLAKALLKENISVELITDAAISTRIGKVDAVLLGADAVLKTGNVINKTGSIAAALLCKYYNKPIYIITTKEKFLNRKSFKQAGQNEDEVWKFKNKNLKISNYYFEEIPQELITKIITN